MKKTKHFRIISIISISVLSIFSIFIFPFILAASPDNLGVEVIDRDEELQLTDLDPVPGDESGTKVSFATDAESEFIPELDPIPYDINAISKERAVELAWELFMFPDEDETTPQGERRGHKTEFIEARYIENTDSAKDPSWFLLFSYHYWGTAFNYVPEGSTPEEEIEREIPNDIFNYATFSVGTDNFGYPVIKWEYNAGHYEMVEINAITGEWIGSGWIKPVYNKDLDEFAFWDDIKRGMDFWWTIKKLPSGEIIREPLYHEEIDYGG